MLAQTFLVLRWRELWGGYLERMEDEVLADTYDREVELQAEMWATRWGYTTCLQSW